MSGFAKLMSPKGKLWIVALLVGALHLSFAKPDIASLQFIQLSNQSMHNNRSNRHKSLRHSAFDNFSGQSSICRSGLEALQSHTLIRKTCVDLSSSQTNWSHLNLNRQVLLMPENYTSLNLFCGHHRMTTGTYFVNGLEIRIRTLAYVHGLRKFFKQFFLKFKIFLRISLNKKETDPHKKAFGWKKLAPKRKSKIMLALNLAKSKRRPISFLLGDHWSMINWKGAKRNNIGFKFGEIIETAHFLSPWWSLIDD